MVVSRAGTPVAGGAGGDVPFNYCPDTGPGGTEREDQLFAALNQAIANKQFCLDQPLQQRPELRCTARAAVGGILAMRMGGGGPGGPGDDGWLARGMDVWWWTNRHANNPTDAKNALLEESERFCDSARGRSFATGIGQFADTWVAIFLAE
jgi:hypothetical protein